MKALRGCVNRAGLFVLVIWCTQAYGQKPEWIRNAEMPEGSYGRTLGKRVAVHPDGSVFVLGQYHGENLVSGYALNSPENTLDDVFLAKYSYQGDLIWLKQIFQSSQYYSNRVIDLKIDHAGDLVFSGSCLWPSSILGSSTGTGPFIAKADKEGNLRWLNFQPTPGTVAEHDTGRRGNRIGFDGNHNILWITDQINEFGPSGSLVVMKYNSEGVKLAAMPITRNPSFYRPHIEDISVLQDGSFIVGGSFPSTVAFMGGPGLNNAGSNTNARQSFLVKYTATGSFTWIVYSNYGRNIITTHTTDHSGNIYVGWQFENGRIYTASQVIDMPNGRHLIRITPDGNLDWFNELPSTNMEDITFASDGLLYITGVAYSTEFRYQSYFRSLAGESGFILKINTDGNFYGAYIGEPEDTPTSPNGAFVSGMQSVVDAAGNIYTIGHFWERQVWGCIPATTREDSFFLLKHSVSPSPIRVIDGPPIICAGTSVTLSTDLISNAVLYKWFTPNGPDPGQGTLLKNSITIQPQLTDHRKPVIVSIVDACDEYFAQPFILNVRKAPATPQLIQSPQDICPGTSQAIGISGISAEDNYVWILPVDVSSAGLSNSGGMLSFADSFREGTIKVQVSNFCGSSELQHLIEAARVPGPPQLSGTLRVCQGNQFIETSVTPVADALSYSWQLPPYIVPRYGQAQVTSVLSAEVQANFTSGEIRVQAIGKCGPGLASSPLFVLRSAPPDAAGTINGPAELCVSGTQPVRFSIPTIPQADKYLWTVNPAAFNLRGEVITTTPFIDLLPSTQATAEITVKGVNTCSDSGEPAVHSIELYEPLATPELTVTQCDRELIVQRERNVDFTWYFNEQPAWGLTGSRITPRDSGTYHVEVSNFCGVKRSEKITVYPLISVLPLQNIITPNNDGKNEFFMLDKSLSNSSITIFNRTGKSIYSSSHYRNDWNASGQSSGIYYYLLSNPCLAQPYKGWIHVVR